MGMPAVLTVVGTASSIWTPDWMQTPFVVGMSLLGTSNLGSGSAGAIQATYDDPNAVASPSWFTIVSGTTSLQTATFTSPCQGFRLTVTQADSTTTFRATLVQATFGR